MLKTMYFIEYIAKPMNKKDIETIFKINQVTNQKCELLIDFIQSLLKKITTTYMGDDLMSEEDQKKHFNWCWDSVLSDFKLEFIFFNKRGMLYEFFSYLILESFYKEMDKSEKNVEKTLYSIINSFNYKKIKTKSEIDNFLDLYKIFNKSFNVSI